MHPTHVRIKFVETCNFAFTCQSHKSHTEQFFSNDKMGKEV